jgi:hypothetical protein
MRGSKPERRRNDVAEVDLVIQKIRCLPDEVVERLSARLTTLRNDLDDRNQAVGRGMTNGDDVLLASVELRIGFGRDTDMRFYHEDPAPGGLILGAVARSARRGGRAPHQ